MSEVKISVVEYLGATTLLSLDINEEINFKATIDGYLDLEREQIVYAFWNSELITLFDPKTGKNLLFED